MGYHQAGWDVVGVDIQPQPRYPFEFVQADALEFLAEHGSEFGAIHASPICQNRTAVTDWRGSRDSHPDLLTPTLKALLSSPYLWVVENAPEAAWDGTLRPDLWLCGSMFGLAVRRHRVFETSWRQLQLTPRCACWRRRDLVPFEHKDEKAFTVALGCDWMTNLGGRQAIPPAYTSYIGELMMAELRERAA
jgi:hypothetical protein